MAKLSSLSRYSRISKSTKFLLSELVGLTSGVTWDITVHGDTFSEAFFSNMLSFGFSYWLEARSWKNLNLNAARHANQPHVRLDNGSIWTERPRGVDPGVSLRKRRTWYAPESNNYDDLEPWERWILDQQGFNPRSGSPSVTTQTINIHGLGDVEVPLHCLGGGNCNSFRDFISEEFIRSGASDDAVQVTISSNAALYHPSRNNPIADVRLSGESTHYLVTYNGRAYDNFSGSAGPRQATEYLMEIIESTTSRADRSRPIRIDLLFTKISSP